MIFKLGIGSALFFYRRADMRKLFLLSRRSKKSTSLMKPISRHLISGTK
jgi:hypothetical protein